MNCHADSQNLCGNDENRDSSTTSLPQNDKFNYFAESNADSAIYLLISPKFHKVILGTLFAYRNAKLYERMQMAFEISKVYGIVHQALDYRSLRQDLIASNLANVATPFYRPQDVAFEGYLTKEANRIFRNEFSKTLPLAQTSAGHLPPIDYAKNQPTIFFRDGHLARNDGNSVDLDVETSEMGKNSVMYNALVNATKKHKNIYSYAIDSGKNI